MIPNYSLYVISYINEMIPNYNLYVIRIDEMVMVDLLL